MQFKRFELENRGHQSFSQHGGNALMSPHQRHSSDNIDVSPPSKPIRVLLVHYHPIVLWELDKLINNGFPIMEVVGKAMNGVEAKLLSRATQPDILLLDLALSGEGTFDLLPYLLAEGKFHIIILCNHSDQAVMDEIVLKGARGVVHKKEPIKTILKAIQKVHEGEVWFDRTTTSRAFANFCRATGRAAYDSNSITARLRLLTERERAIAHTFAKAPGAPNKRIAQILRISEATLRKQLRSIFRKLELSNRFELFMFSEQYHHLLDSAGGLNSKNAPPATRLSTAITGKTHASEPISGNTDNST
jgi:DNA-binding NarL/FixJ family response regulator